MNRPLAKLALLVTSFSLSAMVVEAGLRSFGYQLQTTYVTYLGRGKIEEPLPGVRFVYRAFASFDQAWSSNPRGYFDSVSNSISYRVNNFGFRGDDFTLNRGEKLRVAFLGDSFCWGNGVHEQDLSSSLIANALNRQSTIDQRFEVYNFCLAGYNTEHEAALYDQVVRHFQPDIVVVWYFLNDINRPPNLYFNWKKQDGGDWLGTWRERFHLVDLLVAPLNRARNQSTLKSNVTAAYERGHPGIESVARGLQKIHRSSAETEVGTVLAIFPWLHHLEGESYPFERAHRVVSAIAKDEGFEVLDLLPAFQGRQAEDLWVHPSDQHPNEIAHAIAAQAMFDHLSIYLSQQRDSLLLGAEKRRRKQHPKLRPDVDWYLQFSDFSQQIEPETLQSKRVRE